LPYINGIWFNVPRKVRDLIRELEQAGFINRGGKGSHRNFVHPKVTKPVVICGQLGDDAHHYQEKAVKLAINELKK
jgi:predicted RNA binding protein YcfA (HicA-like mRNA interferase family)